MSTSSGSWRAIEDPGELFTINLNVSVDLVQVHFFHFSERERERERVCSKLECHSESLEKRLPDASYTSTQIRQPFI